jgi:hypothetical protein
VIRIKPIFILNRLVGGSGGAPAGMIVCMRRHESLSYFVSLFRYGDSHLILKGLFHFRTSVPNRNTAVTNIRPVLVGLRPPSAFNQLLKLMI